MNPETFFDRFGLLADTPNGVQKLRELILQLAVQGKLVPQDPNDESAAVLLEKIKAEKDRLVKEKKIKRIKQLPPIEDDEIPYEVPDSWVLCRLSEIIQISSGDFLPSHNMAKDGYIPVFGGNGITGYHNQYNVKEPTLVIGRVGFYCGSVHITPELARITDNAFSTYFSKSHIDLKFLYWLLKGTDLSIRDNSTAQPVISGRKIYPIIVGLPPLEEQRRIVAKVDQLMALCDELEARQQKKREARLHLNSAALDKVLTAHEPVEFAHHWQRVCDNFDLLYDNHENVGELRKAILQLAVQGKLVRQDSNDEPAAVLLGRIKAEKERLVKEKKIKKVKQLPDFEDGELPYEIPNEWLWTRLDQIANSVHYGYTASANHELKDIRLLRITDIQNGRVNWDNVPGCEIDEKIVENYRLYEGDLLIARTGGTIGKSYLVEKPTLCAVFASYIIRVILNSQLFPNYLKIFLESPLYWKQLYEKSMGTGQPNVNGTSLRSLILPLPPLQEQHRIVAKVDQLTALCDELEAKIEQSQTDGKKLMEAVVHQLVAA